MMKRIIQVYAFLYGTIGTLCWFVWYVAAMFGYVAWPDNVWAIEGVFVVHAAAVVATLHSNKNPLRPTWRPLFPIRPGRIMAAQLLLAVAVANFVLAVGAFLVARVSRNVTNEEKTLPLVLGGFLILNTVYMAMHWALRPENLFPSSFLRAVSNPIGTILGRGRNL